MISSPQYIDRGRFSPYIEQGADPGLLPEPLLGCLDRFLDLLRLFFEIVEPFFQLLRFHFQRDFKLFHQILLWGAAFLRRGVEGPLHVLSEGLG